MKGESHNEIHSRTLQKNFGHLRTTSIEALSEEDAVQKVLDDFIFEIFFEFDDWIDTKLLHDGTFDAYYKKHIGNYTAYAVLEK